MSWIAKIIGRFAALFNGKTRWIVNVLNRMQAARLRNWTWRQVDPLKSEMDGEEQEESSASERLLSRLEKATRYWYYKVGIRRNAWEKVHYAPLYSVASSLSTTSKTSYNPERKRFRQALEKVLYSSSIFSSTRFSLSFSLFFSFAADDHVLYIIHMWMKKKKEKKKMQSPNILWSTTKNTSYILIHQDTEEKREREIFADVVNKCWTVSSSLQ
jgi:hypothetical protein